MTLAFANQVLEPGLHLFVEHGRKQKLKRKEELSLDPARGGAIYMVISGTMSLAINDEDGTTLILNHLTPGDIFGEDGIFPNTRRQPNTPHVIARSNCEIASIPHSRFQGLIEQHPLLLITICQRLANRLQATTNKLTCLAFLEIAQHILIELRELCRHGEAMTHPNGMQIKVSRQELARMTNCSRETAGRAIKELALQGFIEVAGHSIVVLGTR